MARNYVWVRRLIYNNTSQSLGSFLELLRKKENELKLKQFEEYIVTHDIKD